MENLELCAKCKGKCCKAMGCHFSPDDFKDLSYEGLKKEMDKGYISIDWYEGNPFDPDKRDEIPRVLFLRIRNRDSGVVDPSWGGTCSLLTDTGCTLSYDKRPKAARELIPATPNCIVKYDKNQCARDWYKYDDTLRKLEEEYIKNDIENKYQTDYETNSAFDNVVSNKEFDVNKIMSEIMEELKNFKL